MMPREKRLLRLVELRERQHDVAALRLRGATGDLAAAESAARAAHERTRAAQLCRLAATAGQDPHEWLLACADVEVSTLIAANQYVHVARARTSVEQASETEAGARHERKQMEVTLEFAQRDGAEQAARAEQGALDEIVRLQRAGTAARAAMRLSWRRDL